MRYDKFLVFESAHHQEMENEKSNRIAPTYIPNTLGRIQSYDPWGVSHVVMERRTTPPMNCVRQGIQVWIGFGRDQRGQKAMDCWLTAGNTTRVLSALLCSVYWTWWGPRWGGRFYAGFAPDLCDIWAGERHCTLRSGFPLKHLVIWVAYAALSELISSQVANPSPLFNNSVT